MEAISRRKGGVIELEVEEVEVEVVLRILIAEDSEDDAELIVHHIKRAGYRLIYKRVDNARELTAALRKENWDAVISDYSMPSFSGLNALQTLKKSGLDLPFILISGAIGEDIAVEAMKAGAHDYIMKDNLTRLVPAIEREIREAGVRTSKKSIEHERIVLVDRLQEALRARDEFLVVASHELRTPLTSLVLQTQIIKQINSQNLPQEVKEQRRQEVMVSLEKQIGKLTNLIENLLDVSRISVGQFTINPSKFDLRSLVEEVLQDLCEDLRQAKCQTEIHSVASVIGEWDRLRMEQVIVNLIGNAIKYAKGSAITITIEPSGENARLIIQDRGPGISKANQAKLFRRFERAASSDYVGGLGLGLYITRQIIHAHGGWICLESEVGKGSKFIVEIPIKPALIKKQAA